MDRLNINIDGLTFDHAEYDTEGDVLYLARGEGGTASDGALTPEGHGIRYGPNGEVMGVTIINARFILRRDGHITITLPRQVRVDEDVLAPALS